MQAKLHATSIKGVTVDRGSADSKVSLLRKSYNIRSHKNVVSMPIIIRIVRCKNINGSYRTAIKRMFEN